MINFRTPYVEYKKRYVLLNMESLCRAAAEIIDAEIKKAESK